MTESEKKELKEKALGVLRAMKKEPPVIHLSDEESRKFIERSTERRKVYERLFPEDRDRDLEDKNLFKDRMNCIAKAQVSFHWKEKPERYMMCGTPRCNMRHNMKVSIQQYLDTMKVFHSLQKELLKNNPSIDT